MSVDKKKSAEREIDLKRLCERWPSEIIAREQIGNFSGGAMSPRYVANLDSVGEGPPRFMVGRKVCYFTKDLVDWMQKRVSMPKRNNYVFLNRGKGSVKP